MKWAPFGASTTPSTIERLMRSVWYVPASFASSSVGTIRSTDTKRLPSAAPQHEVVEVEVGAEELRRCPARRPGSGGTSAASSCERRHGDELLAVARRDG